MTADFRTLLTWPATYVSSKPLDGQIGLETSEDGKPQMTSPFRDWNELLEYNSNQA